MKILTLTAILLTPAWTMNYEAMASRIINALKLEKGERVVIRYDARYFHELVGPLERRIRQAGATARPLKTAEPLGGILETTDVYLWLPVRTDIPAADRKALANWLDQGGTHREIHFHWSAGSVQPDGIAGEHTPALDGIYEAALDIDYAALSAAQDRAIARLRSGTVRVRTPAGTDVSFRVGDRPFNKQDGDASPQRVRRARVRVDREIELPAGVLRVAPVEETVNGVIVVPEARFGDQVATGIRYEIAGGRLTRVTAKSGLEAARKLTPPRFREFGLGFNPKLRAPAGSSTLAYYGYGTGVVRLSFGDNQELGGAVRGDTYRWFFFPDASVDINGKGLDIYVEP